MISHPAHVNQYAVTLSARTTMGSPLVDKTRLPMCQSSIHLNWEINISPTGLLVLMSYNKYHYFVIRLPSFSKFHITHWPHTKISSPRNEPPDSDPYIYMITVLAQGFSISTHVSSPEGEPLIQPLAWKRISQRFIHQFRNTADDPIYVHEGCAQNSGTFVWSFKTWWTVQKAVASYRN